MKTEPGNVRSFTSRLVVMLPVFLFLMGMGVACEDALQLKENNTVSSDASLTSGQLAFSSLPHTNVTSLAMPVSVAYELTTYDCSNNPGPKITFSGLASTIGFGVRTIFRNNMKGTHELTEEQKVDV